MIKFESKEVAAARVSEIEAKFDRMFGPRAANKLDQRQHEVLKTINLIRDCERNLGYWREEYGHGEKIAAAQGHLIELRARLAALKGAN